LSIALSFQTLQVLSFEPKFTWIIFLIDYFTCNDSITFIVEPCWENFISMSYLIITSKGKQDKPSRTCNSSPSSADQILAVLSALAVITFDPWGLNETLEISASWPKQ